MKKRILVMNGQKIVQSEAGGKWNNDSVEKAGLLKPNIYNIYMAKIADPKSESIGTIIHADKDKIYQQIGREFVMHDKDKFDKLPEIGSVQSITYEESGKIKLSAAAVKSRKLSR